MDLNFFFSLFAQDDYRAFRRQLEDKRIVIESNLLSGRQYVANEPLPADLNDIDSKFLNLTVFGVYFLFDFRQSPGRLLHVQWKFFFQKLNSNFESWMTFMFSCWRKKSRTRFALISFWTVLLFKSLVFFKRSFHFTSILTKKFFSNLVL